MKAFHWKAETCLCNTVLLLIIVLLYYICRSRSFIRTGNKHSSRSNFVSNKLHFITLIYNQRSFSLKRFIKDFIKLQKYHGKTSAGKVFSNHNHHNNRNHIFLPFYSRLVDRWWFPYLVTDWTNCYRRSFLQTKRNPFCCRTHLCHKSIEQIFFFFPWKKSCLCKVSFLVKF